MAAIAAAARGVPEGLKKRNTDEALRHSASLTPLRPVAAVRRRGGFGVGEPQTLSVILGLDPRIHSESKGCLDPRVKPEGDSY